MKLNTLRKIIVEQANFHYCICSLLKNKRSSVSMHAPVGLQFHHLFLLPSSLLVSFGGSPMSMENLTIFGVIVDILLLKQ